MTTFFKGGMRALAFAAAALSLVACATVDPVHTVKEAARQPLPPPAADPAAAEFKWQPTINFQVQVDRGFDAAGTLRPDGEMTFGEAGGVAQISGRCASGIQKNVKGIGWLELRRTFRAGGAQSIGSLVGTWAGFAAPTASTFRQVVGLTAGSSVPAAWDQIDWQIELILDSAHAQCVLDRTKKNSALLHDVIIVMTPGLRGKPLTPMGPGVKLLVPDDDYDRQTGEEYATKPTS